MKKTMRKSALLSSVAMLIVSAIVLTSATYAWFSSSKQVYVKELEANVKVTTGLLISVDKGGEWGTSFEFKDAVAVKTGWGAASEVQTFNPVSTADGNNWFAATYEDGALTSQTVNYGKDFVAVPIWVTGPAGAEVEAIADFTDTEGQSLKCMKFTLLKADDGETVSETYSKAVAADDSRTGFNGISSAGTVANTDENDATNAFISDGGKSIEEVALDGGITFTIPDDGSVTTTAPLKYIAYIWLEGNDPDCAMQQFDVAGEDVVFNLSLKIVE